MKSITNIENIEIVIIVKSLEKKLIFFYHII